MARTAEQNREHGRAQYRKNPEAYKRRAREWHRANPEKNRRKVSEFYRRNPEKRVEKQARRRARLRAVSSLPVDLDAVYAAGNLCGICGEPIEEIPHLDHIVSLARGGVHATENLQLAHPVCNSKKGAG